MTLSRKSRLFLEASAGVLTIALSILPAHAQEAKTDTPAAAPATDKDDETTIVVIGVREALKKAKDIKRDAETIVDSITATDVGALPDKSVAEALQRVPGVTVSRFAATGDTQHFSAEPSGVVIRGLNQVRSEFNGRDTFSADSSRGLSWEDITPELMSRIDVYKNQSADLIEGGIAGVIDLHTRVPFDFKGQEIAGSAEVNYSAVANSYNPNISALYSNRWSTGIGDFGVLVQGAFSRLNTRSEGIYLGRMGIYEAGALADGVTYAPTFITARDNLYERRRTGGAFAAQWKSPSGALLATVQYNRSNYHQVNTEYSALNWNFYLWGKRADYVIPKGWADGLAALPGQKLEFGSDGSFQRGMLSSPHGWWGGSIADAAAFGVNSSGIPLVNPTSCEWGGPAPEYNAAYCDAPYNRIGTLLETNSRQITEDSMTQDVSFNLKWSPSSWFHANFDVQYVDATRRGYGAAGGLQTYSGLYADFTGKLPSITYSDPLNVNLSPGGLTNPNNWVYNWIQDHRERSNGHSLALKADGEYTFNSDWLASLRFGARYVDRDQENRNAWNFRGITSRWQNAAYYNADKTSPIASTTYANQPTFFAGYPMPSVALQQRSFRANYMGGGVMDQTPLLYINPNLLGNNDLVNQYFDRANLGVGDFSHICSAQGNRSNEILNPDGSSTCFTPGETVSVGERVKAAYVMLRFGGKNAHIFGSGITLSGNVGVRFVETHSISRGKFYFGSFSPTALDCFENRVPTTVDPNNPYRAPSTPYSPGCYIVGAAAHNATVPSLPDKVDNGSGVMIDNPRKFYLPAYVTGARDDIAFLNNSTQDITGDRTYRNWLPSVNLKVDFGHDYIARFAYSKAMSRPDLSLFRFAAQLDQSNVDVSFAAQCLSQDATTGVVTPTPNCTRNPELIYDSQGRLTGASPRYQVNTGNPFIRPITADNFDVTFEHYWTGVGQATINLFYKKFYDYITYGTIVTPVTNNGVTRNLYIAGPVNGDGASVKGFELSYQTVLSFLPKPFDTLGFQANYTRVINSGVQNTNYDSGSGGAVDQRDFYLKTDHLEGMSDHAYNIVAFYERGPFALRAAYNWRSKYLVTANDCCNLPVWQSGQGFLDASIRYRVNPNVEINLQASNLLDGTTHLLQQVTASDDPKDPNHLVPTAWFKSDRRVSLGVRGRF